MKPDPVSFKCPICGAISYNPNDARERYCVRCHRFVDDPAPHDLLTAPDGEAPQLGWSDRALPEWTEGVCGDGAAILRDGVMVKISEILERLNFSEECRTLLSDGLDLCVRARKLDEPTMALEAEWDKNPHMSRSATLPIWVQDQYDRDLADWETRARRVLARSV